MKKFILEIFILALISSLIIFYKFNLIPQNLSFDEVEFAKLALSLDKTPYTPYSPAASGHSTLYFYFLLGSFKIFGINNFALRLPSAVFGVISVLIFYLIMRNLVKPWNNVILKQYLPLVASLLLISSHWYFNFARFSFEATFLIFLELTALLFLFKFFSKNNFNYLSLSAVFTGLAFHSYYAGRIFFLLPLLALLVKKYTKKAVYFLIIFLIIASPLLIYNLQHPAERVTELLINNFLMFFENLKRLLLMFNIEGDMNGRHNFPGKPALNPILGLLFLFGFGLLIKKISRFENKLMLSYFILSLIPSLLTIPKDNPNMLRTFTALPSTIYFSILSLSFFLSLKYKFKNLIIFVSCLLLFISSFYELRTYFSYQSRVFKNSFEVKCNLEQIIKLKTSTVPKWCRVQKNEF